jgi:hypothetical protein
LSKVSFPARVELAVPTENLLQREHHRGIQVAANASVCLVKDEPSIVSQNGHLPHVDIGESYDIFRHLLAFSRCSIHR